jgi:hypothetical protein
MEFQHYRQPIFQGQCINYSLIGFEYLKTLKIPKLEVKLKRHLINENDKNLSRFHYYLELFSSTIDGKYIKIIIDCEDSYKYQWYKERYKPKQVKSMTNKFVIDSLRFVDKDNTFISSVHNNINHYLMMHNIFITSSNYN